MYKTGDRFVIEIEEEFTPKTGTRLRSNTPDKLYRVKGFNSLIFDEYGLDKLVKSSDDAAYKRGLNDAWNAARKIGGIGEGVIPCKDLQRLFGVDVPCYIFKNTQVFDALQIVREYEKEKEAEQEIKVGDELISEDGERTVIIDIEYKTWRVFNGYETTDIYDIQKTHWKKTGRHFPQIAEVLKQMQEDK